MSKVTIGLDIAKSVFHLVFMNHSASRIVKVMSRLSSPPA